MVCLLRSPAPVARVTVRRGDMLHMHMHMLQMQGGAFVRGTRVRDASEEVVAPMAALRLVRRVWGGVPGLTAITP